jgi:hypothetical protein
MRSRAWLLAIVARQPKQSKRRSKHELPGWEQVK